MSVLDHLFPLGIGTNRFAVKNAGDEDGLDRAAAVVSAALDAGCSYVDVSSSYSKGFAGEICKRAFRLTNAPRNVAVKVSFLSDVTADDALRRVESEFEKLGIGYASFFVVWNIASLAQFQQIMAKGSLYEGAVRAKERGLVDHICFSSHAKPDEIIRMLDSGAFEGVTLSVNALNGAIMKPVLNRAAEKNVGVVVMNPLGGGLIPQNAGYYHFLCASEEETTVQAALRYVYAHPAVKVVLSGMASPEELRENLAAFQQPPPETDTARLARVDEHFHSVEGFCTSCRYCDGCPANIPIYALMQAYNTRLFPHPNSQYGRSDPELLDAIGICSRLRNTFGFLPEDAGNPCIGCRRCEARCTAHLPIIRRVRELYGLFDRVCFSKKGMLERLRELVGDARRVGFYPGGGYTAYVLGLLKEAYPSELFELYAFDTNPSQWGAKVGGVTVEPPEKILERNPEVLIVSNFIYAEEIYRSLSRYAEQGIRIKKLHREGDVPWVF